MAMAKHTGGQMDFQHFFYIDIDSCMVGFESSVHSISVDNNPYAPCMEYLRTFALIRTQM